MGTRWNKANDPWKYIKYGSAQIKDSSIDRKMI